MARSGNCWKRLAAIPPKAKKAAQTCQITHLGSRWSRVTPPRLRREAKTSTLSRVGPAFRIPSPPAESQVRTCLSREFAFLGREAAVFRGCPGRDERPGSAETRRRGNIWPKGGDISVGPYPITAPPVMRSAAIRRCRVQLLEIGDDGA